MHTVFTPATVFTLNHNILALLLHSYLPFDSSVCVLRANSASGAHTTL